MTKKSIERDQLMIIVLRRLLLSRLRNLLLWLLLLWNGLSHHQGLLLLLPVNHLLLLLQMRLRHQWRRLLLLLLKMGWLRKWLVGWKALHVTGRYGGNRHRHVRWALRYIAGGGHTHRHRDVNHSGSWVRTWRDETSAVAVVVDWSPELQRLVVAASDNAEGKIIFSQWNPTFLSKFCFNSLISDSCGNIKRFD